MIESKESKTINDMAESEKAKLFFVVNALRITREGKSKDENLVISMNGFLEVEDVKFVVIPNETQIKEALNDAISSICFEMAYLNEQNGFKSVDFLETLKNRNIGK
jgi:hypothetical protein